MKTYNQKVESTAASLDELARQREKPRHVWLMIPAGKVTEDAFQQLLGILEPDDAIVDGGNSNFRDSQRRHTEAAEKQISFVDAGVSGGVWGRGGGWARRGGGDEGHVTVAGAG